MGGTLKQLCLEMQQEGRCKVQVDPGRTDMIVWLED